MRFQNNKHLKYVDINLSRIKLFMESIDNPHLLIDNIIHVAGTNGKGSTSSFIYNILKNHGYNINVFTSPHLINEEERIRVNNQIISSQHFKELKNNFSSIDGYNSLTFFEKYCALAFDLFSKSNADFTILETGLGGLLDATNIVNSKYSVITPIDFDHQQFLGNTLAKIAEQKAGIIKKDTVVFSAPQKLEVKQVLLQNAKSKNSKIEIIENSKDFSEFNFSKLHLKGAHQKINSTLALAVSKHILKDEFSVEKAQSAINNTVWPARLQFIDSLYGTEFKNSECILDGAHNKHSMESLINFINDYACKHNFNKVYVFLAVLKSKDLQNILRIIKKINNLVLIPIQISDHNCFTSLEIKQAAEELSINIHADPYKTSFSEYKEIYNNLTTEKNLFVITGSLYLIGNILRDNNFNIT